MARRWKSILTAFSERDLKEIMRQEQLSWVKERDACGDESACLKKAYEDRLQHLEGSSTNGAYSGEWRADKMATATIYKIAGPQYLVAVHVSDPTAGAWTCDVAGRASVESGKLALVIEGHKIIITKLTKHQVFRHVQLQEMVEKVLPGDPLPGYAAVCHRKRHGPEGIGAVPTDRLISAPQTPPSTATC